MQHGMRLGDATGYLKTPYGCRCVVLAISSATRGPVGSRQAAARLGAERASPVIKPCAEWEWVCVGGSGAGAAPHQVNGSAGHGGQEGGVEARVDTLEREVRAFTARGGRAMPTEAASGRVVDGSVGAHLDENAFPGKARPPVVGTHAPPGPSSGAGSGFGSGHTPWQRVLAHLEQGNLNAAFHEALNSQRGSDSALVRLLGRVDPCLHKLTPETGGAVVKRLGSMVLDDTHAELAILWVAQVGVVELALQEGMKVRVTASGEQNFSGTKSLVIKELA